MLVSRAHVVGGIDRLRCYPPVGSLVTLHRRRPFSIFFSGLCDKDFVVMLDKGSPLRHCVHFGKDLELSPRVGLLFK